MYSTAMILAAGFGKRLSPLTLSIPKPLLPVGGVPCLMRTVKELKARGVQKIIINTHHLHEQFEDLFKYDPSIHLIHESEILETGGGILNALDQLDDPLFVISGDIWMNNFDILEQMYHMFDPDIMDGLLMMVPLENTLFFESDGDYAAEEEFLKSTFPIIHKKTLGIKPSFVYGGVQVWRKQTLNDYQNSQKSFSMVEVFHKSESEKRLWGIRFDHLWCDIGTLTAYYNLNNFINTPLAD